MRCFACLLLCRSDMGNEHSLCTILQVKATRQDNMHPTDGTQHPPPYRNGAAGGIGPTGTGVQHGANGVGVQALGEDLSQLDLSETRPDSRNHAAAVADSIDNTYEGGGRAGGGEGGGMHYSLPEHELQRDEHMSHQHYHNGRRESGGCGRDGGEDESGGGLKRPLGPSGTNKGPSGDRLAGAARRPTAAEAAELLRRRCDLVAIRRNACGD